MRNLVLVVCILSLNILPIAVQGEELEIQYWIYPSNVPDIMTVGKEFRMGFLIDWEISNGPDPELYNTSTYDMRVDVNITLSEGLHWIWQSETQSLRFWITIKRFFGLSSHAVPKFEIEAIKPGFQTISISLFPALGTPYQTELGIWVTPRTSPLFDLLTDYWVPLLFGSSCICFWLGTKLEAYVQKHEQRERQEAR